MFDLSGKKALITGGTQGIGFAVAVALANAGATVYIGGSTPEKARCAAQQIPGAQVAVCNLAASDCAEQLYTVTGDVDILVLCASIQYRRSWDTISDQELEHQLSVNFKSSLKLIQQYVPAMQKKHWGRIVTVGSVQQYKPHKDMLIYAASKAAQENMMRNLAKQLAGWGITVNNVAPGVIDTPRNTKALADVQYAAKVLEGIPCGYIGQPEDCAVPVLMLCSKEGRYITGTTIDIDGGMRL